MESFEQNEDDQEEDDDRDNGLSRPMEIIKAAAKRKHKKNRTYLGSFGLSFGHPEIDQKSREIAERIQEGVAHDRLYQIAKNKLI